jgi:ABC-2 type transport system ATP-binding protein
MQNVVEVHNLFHSYGSHEAIRDMSFSLGKGEVLGVLGPNGSGKTTTVRLLNGLFPPTSGTISVLGHNPQTQGNLIRRKTGVLTETPALYERLTARENLMFFGTLAEMSKPELSQRVEELLALFELSHRADDRAETYSKGMKQRLALARSLLHDPELLFLDEPVSGLDPEAAHQVNDLIAEVSRKNGQSVMICTHNLFEAERLCDRLVIINSGQVLAEGSMEELRQRVIPGYHVAVTLAETPSVKLLTQLRQQSWAKNVETSSETRFTVQVESMEVVPDMVDWLVQSQCRIMAVHPSQATLEDIYFKLQNLKKEGRK